MYINASLRQNRFPRVEVVVDTVVEEEVIQVEDTVVVVVTVVEAAQVARHITTRQAITLRRPAHRTR
jgi:hypothetical protein